MKQYLQTRPLLRFGCLFAVLGLLPFFASGQGIKDPRWYFGNSPEWISFLNGRANLVQDQAQQQLGIGGSVVATDQQSGELLFYAGGGLVVNGNNDSQSLGGDPDLTQPVHAVPAGIPDTYYLFVLNSQGGLQYYTYDYVQNILSAPTVLDLSGNTASGTMELIRAARPSGYVYWLLIPLAPQNGITQLALLSLAGGAPAAPVIFSLNDLPYPINVSTLAYSEQKGLLAVGSAASTDPAPLLVFSFNNSPGTPEFERLGLVDTLSTLTAQNGGISGLAWKENYLYAAKSENASGAGSGVYRLLIDDEFDNTPDAELIPGSSFALGYDLKTGPDGRVYHLYQQQAGGPLLAGYVRNSGTANPAFEAAAFGTVDFGGEQFNKQAPPPTKDYNVAFNYVNACTELTTYFYPKFAEKAPERVEWRLGGPNGRLFSTLLQPVADTLFQQTGAQQVSLTAYYADGVETVTQTVTVGQGYTLEVEPEYILCPGESKWAAPKLTQGGQDVPTNGALIFFKPRSVKKLSGVQAVEQADSIELVATAVPDPLDPSIMTYPVAGTYFVVYNDPQTGCQVSASFRVRVYNYEYSKANLWYFGDGAELDFTTGEPSPDAEYPNPMLGADGAPQGVTLTVDANVDPLFSTNGEKLWVRDYQPVPLDDQDDPAPNADNNPTGETLGGSKEVSQNSLFEPFPGNPALYYLFTISGPNAPQQRALWYNVTDLKGNASINSAAPVTSDVEQATDPSAEYIRARLLQTEVAEKLISVSGDSSKVWVITHGLNNNRFYSYPVTADGVGAPVESSAGSVYSESDAAGYLMASSDGNMLAAALSNGVEVYRFDKATGKVLPDGAVRLNVNTPAYGVSFSPDDERLFFTAGTKLYQTSIDSALTQDYLQRSLIEVADAPETLGAIQLAPNNRLYVARPETNQLAVINAPNDSVTSDNKTTAFTLDGLQNPLAGSSKLGLPNLRRQAGDSPNEPTVSANNACFGEDVVARGTNRYNNELFVFILKKFENNQWVEQERAGPQEADSVQYEALAPGRYQVELQLQACELTYPISLPDYEGEEPVIAEFEVFPEAEAVITNESPNLCNQQSVLLTAEIRIDGQPVDPAQYEIQWFFLNNLLGTGPTYEATRRGQYRVEAVNLITQCAAKPMAIDVLDYRPDATLGDDISICPGEDLPATLKVEINGANVYTINWLRSVNFGPFQALQNATTDEVSISDINNQAAGNYRYIVEVMDDLAQDCKKIDTLTIQINPQPIVSLRAGNNDCSGSGVDLTAAVQGSGTYNFAFFRDGTQVANNTSGTIRVTEDGLYTVQATATDNSIACPGESEAVDVKLFDPIASLSIEVEEGCRTAEGTGTNTLTASTAYTGEVVYRWAQINQDGQVVRYLTETTASVVVPDGIYRVWAKAKEAPAGCPDAAIEKTADATAQSVLSPSAIIQPDYTLCPNIASRRTVTIGFEGQNYENVVLLNRTTGREQRINLPYVTIDEAGTYEIQVGGCAEPAVFNVTVDCAPSLILPNAIRPNSGRTPNKVLSILDQEMVAGIDASDFEVLVYDRWGEVIWRDTKPDFAWPGVRQGGRAVPMGNYVYLIRYKNKYGEDSQVKQYIGSVFVMY